MTADEIIRLLDLQPHPEGGYFRETFRDRRVVDGGRAASTAIYFLLAEANARAGTKSMRRRSGIGMRGRHWRLGIAGAGSGKRVVRLGNDLAAGAVPQAVVPADAWQQAESLGDWTLVGCTVAPGFEFSAFVIAEQGFEPGA